MRVKLYTLSSLGPLLLLVGCTGSSIQPAPTPMPTPTPVATISSINHVIILVQENRSLDNYLGQLRQYWAQNGYPDQAFDGLPQFNPTSGAAPLQGPAPSNTGCNPNDPAPSDCIPDTTNPVTSFHLKTMCTENTSPSWDEAHNDWDINDNLGNNPAANNGFVYTAAYDGRALDYYDTNGTRAMGYYDGTDLNFLYFMASNFATSDRFSILLWTAQTSAANTCWELPQGDTPIPTEPTPRTRPSSQP